MQSATDIESIEATGERFSIQELLYVRARTRRAVHMIADRVKVGMKEEEAKVVARSILTSLGMRRGWHHIIVRCGPNTTKDFMERSEPGSRSPGERHLLRRHRPHLQGLPRATPETPSSSVTIRTIIGRSAMSGPYGTTYGEFGSTNTSPDRSCTSYAEKAAEKLGWRLNLDLSGHRLSDYPHSAHYDGSMADVPFRPNPNLWVLEIAIAHPDRGFGAFYEDLLLVDQSFPEAVFVP